MAGGVWERRAGSGRRTAVLSLDLVHLLLDVPDAPAPAERSAVDYVAVYLDGTGACASLVRDCLRGLPGAAALLRGTLGDALCASGPSLVDTGGPMAPEALGLVAVLRDRARALSLL